jgi:HTH-type transcriptional regulator, glycine betaine synthesis regulator
MNAASPDLSVRLADIDARFVDLWGTMSSLWGINPTMARIHGLLYITGAALTMDEMMARLGISRGNVSMNLAKLVEWGLVRREHRRGDRKERYASVSDVWEMFTRVAAQRKRREIDPVLTTLRQCREELSPEGLGEQAATAEAKERYRRVDDLLAFLQLMDHLAQQFLESHKSLRAAVEMLSKK